MPTKTYWLRGNVWQVVTLLKNFAEVRIVWNNHQRHEQEVRALEQELRQLGFEWRLGNPALNVGTALELAEEYHVALHRGTCYGDCIADILREHWRCPINPNIKSGRFGTWFEDQPHEEIYAVYAYGRDVQTAICQCLVNARIAGVI